MTVETQPDLDRLRRRATAKMIHVKTALIERSASWREWQSIAHQLTSMGFRDVDHPYQTEHELTMIDWFLATWLDLLGLTDGII